MWLWGLMAAAGERSTRALHGRDATIPLAKLAGASCLRGSLEALRGRSVLVAVRDQLTAALALIELDGVARRIVLCPPGTAAEHLPGVVDEARVEACVGEPGGPDITSLHASLRVAAKPELVASAEVRRRSEETEWILLTSGTTGAPKLVLHTLASLTAATARQPLPADAIVWSTFYDIRRYGGLQIFLRAVQSGSLVLSDPSESVADFLDRVAATGVTHISGTPSHWRRALMSGALSKLAPRYVRLSGEIADQTVLDNLRAAFPGSRVAHAFATTEAGVAFEVDDGLAGFPSSLVGAPGDVELKVTDDTLRIRSPGNAVRYLGDDAPLLKDDEGFVDTGDRLEEREGRYFFLGRSGGVINVGGLKVHPEEVEAVINSHPWVRLSLVRPRRNPITGAVVAAEVVLADAANGRGERPSQDVLTREIVEACRRVLPPHKVPALIRFVPALEMSASGKLVRPRA